MSPNPEDEVLQNNIKHNTETVSDVRRSPNINDYCDDTPKDTRHA